MDDRSSHLDDYLKLSFFADIGLGIAKAKDLDETLKQVMNKIGDIFVPLNWSLMLKDNQTGELYFKLVTGKSAEKLRGKKLPKGKGLANWILENGQAVIVEDVKKDPRHYDHFDRLTGFETKSIIGVPLKVKDEVIGVIELVNKLEKNAFTPTDLKILQTIADFTAITLEKTYYMKRLENLARIDMLTGVSNRRDFNDNLEKEIERSQRHGSSLALLILDVDDFKKINDTRGHQEGDRVLKAVADVLKKKVRTVDFVSRYGGDEFVVLMPNTDIKGAEIIKKRILSSAPYPVSIGIHAAGPDKLSGLLKKADQDLYEQKKLKGKSS